MHWTVVIPVKPAASGKSRLGLGAEVARAIAFDTVVAVVACPVVERVLVVTADDRFRPPGAEIIIEQSPAGINQAIRSAAARAGQGFRAALLGDLPSLRPDDLAAGLALAAVHPGTFVADAESTGTTMVTAAHSVPLVTAFGPNSASAHRSLGLVQLPIAPESTLIADVDTPAQLERARGLGIGPATRAVLAAADS